MGRLSPAEFPYSVLQLRTPVTVFNPEYKDVNDDDLRLTSARRTDQRMIGRQSREEKRNKGQAVVSQGES